MACEDVFIEHLQYAIISFWSSDVTEPGFLLIVQLCVQVNMTFSFQKLFVTVHIYLVKNGELFLV